MEFIDLVVKQGMIDNTTEDRKLAAQKIVAAITKLAANDAAPKSAEALTIRPNESYTPQGDTLGSSAGPIAEFLEFCLYYDANEDGIAESIMMICDKKSQQPIYYETVANITTDGLRPFDIVRINPIEGRWYGMGIVELFESYQTITDLLVNRWNFSQSRSGRIDLFRPNNTLEGDNDPNLKMN